MDYLQNSCVHAAFRTMNHAGLIKSKGYPSAALPQAIYKMMPYFKKTLEQT